MPILNSQAKSNEASSKAIFGRDFKLRHSNWSSKSKSSCFRSKQRTKFKLSIENCELRQFKAKVCVRVKGFIVLVVANKRALKGRRFSKNPLKQAIESLEIEYNNSDWIGQADLNLFYEKAGFKCIEIHLQFAPTFETWNSDWKALFARPIFWQDNRFASKAANWCR